MDKLKAELKTNLAELKTHFKQKDQMEQGT